MSENSFPQAIANLATFLHVHDVKSDDGVEVVLRFPSQQEAHRMDMLLQHELRYFFRGITAEPTRTVSDPGKFVTIMGLRIRFEWRA
jgi:hypothetical protein